MAKQSPAASVLGVLIQVPPLAYITATGDAPMWCRIWIGAWLGLWVLTIAAAAALNSN
ncbi:hypothetical protein ACGFZP_12815 [Kitasatospora sp. NPDC048239]|uniref:hypothetical protein n=1 Tax=Kitasatospora sp. NPDC048239 TaxID=3364046 RepID=UPI00371EF874